MHSPNSPRRYRLPGSKPRPLSMSLPPTIEPLSPYNKRMDNTTISGSPPPRQLNNHPRELHLSNFNIEDDSATIKQQRRLSLFPVLSPSPEALSAARDKLAREAANTTGSTGTNSSPSSSLNSNTSPRQSPTSPASKRNSFVPIAKSRSPAANRSNRSSLQPTSSPMASPLAKPGGGAKKDPLDVYLANLASKEARLVELKAQIEDLTKEYDTCKLDIDKYKQQGMSLVGMPLRSMSPTRSPTRSPSPQRSRRSSVSSTISAREDPFRLGRTFTEIGSELKTFVMDVCEATFGEAE